MNPELNRIQEPSFSFRMTQRIVPKVTHSVMVQVSSIDANGADCYILEFLNLLGRIEDPSCIDRTKVGRVEAVMVVGYSEGVPLLSLEIEFKKKYTREQRYNRRKFVQKILTEVAKDLSCNLEDVYRTCNWPVYDELVNHLPEFLASLSLDKLRNSISSALFNFPNESWRLKNPSILNLKPVVLLMPVYICWAIALIRQMEAEFKLFGGLEHHIYFSLQDLINKVDEDDLIESLDIEDLAPALNVFTSYGILRAQDSPLTCVKSRRVSDKGLPKYFLKAYHIFHEHIYTEDEWDNLIVEKTRRCPAAATVVWFPSYTDNTTGVFIPTLEELRLFEADLCGDFPTHTMLLTGPVTHDDGTKMLEFQDGGDDVGNGDRGFIYFPRKPNTIIEIVGMEFDPYISRD